VKKELFLTEDLTKGPTTRTTRTVGAKLMAEFTLSAYHKEHGIGQRLAVFHGVRPRGVENHAVIANDCARVHRSIAI